MKVVVLCPLYLSPSEVFIGRQTQGLSARVVAFRRGPNQDFAAGLDVAYVADADRRPPIPLLIRQALSERLLGLTSFYWSKRSEAALREELARGTPDVALIEYGPLALQIAPICRDLGLPAVVHFHGYDLSRLHRRAGYRRALGRTARYLSGCVVVNDLMRDRLRRLAFPDEMIRLIPYGVPLDRFRSGGDPGRDPCRFLAVGRFTEKKSPFDLVRAFARCLDVHPETRLTLAGFGELESETLALIRRIGVEGAVEMVGAVSSQRVAELMSSASVFVQHSVTAADGDEEGWPVAIAEACASGLPVVSTRHAGIPLQVADGVSGYLVDEHDWRAMGDRMSELAQDPDLRRTLGGASRTHIEHAGNLDQQIEELRSFLSDCARAAPRGAKSA